MPDENSLWRYYTDRWIAFEGGSVTIAEANAYNAGFADGVAAAKEIVTIESVETSDEN